MTWVQNKDLKFFENKNIFLNTKDQYFVRVFVFFHGFVVTCPLKVIADHAHSNTALLRCLQVAETGRKPFFFFFFVLLSYLE